MAISRVWIDRAAIAIGMEGRSNDQIGAALGIGAMTVETQLARLFERFGIAS